MDRTEKPQSEWTQEDWDAHWAEYEENEEQFYAQLAKAEAELAEAKRKYVRGVTLLLAGEYALYMAIGLVVVLIGFSISPWVGVPGAIVYVGGFAYMLALAVRKAVLGE